MLLQCFEQIKTLINLFNLEEQLPVTLIIFYVTIESYIWVTCTYKCNSLDKYDNIQIYHAWEGYLRKMFVTSVSVKGNY